VSGRKSERLRLAEVRAVFHLVDECRELGADHLAWRSHLAAHLSPLVGGQVAMVLESATPPDPAMPGRVFGGVAVGWPSAQAQEIWTSYFARGDYQREPLFQAIQPLAIRRGLCSRDQAVDDPTWFGSTFYNETLRLCECGDMLVSFRDLRPGRRQNFVSVYRPLGAGVFRRRERHLVRLLHQELGRHFGVALATLDDPSPSDLTPRQRATLRCLLEGDGEKQVAARLGVSTLTVHSYVKALYRHFGVASRPELLAYFLRRSGLRLPAPDDSA
jgi:DNA-binding CsgD family transcriptional regulator